NSLADKLFEKLKPRFLMVVVKAKHLCMVMRGVKENGNMITSAIRWREDYYDKISHLKQEFLSLLEIKEDII
ncbi:MAG: GTP cyclohydrolase I FolE, partial [Thermoplasmata archaeon]